MIECNNDCVTVELYCMMQCCMKMFMISTQPNYISWVTKTTWMFNTSNIQLSQLFDSPIYNTQVGMTG